MSLSLFAYLSLSLSLSEIGQEDPRLPRRSTSSSRKEITSLGRGSALEIGKLEEVGKHCRKRVDFGRFDCRYCLYRPRMVNQNSNCSDEEALSRVNFSRRDVFKERKEVDYHLLGVNLQSRRDKNKRVCMLNDSELLENGNEKEKPKKEELCSCKSNHESISKR